MKLNIKIATRFHLLDADMYYILDVFDISFQ